MKRCAASSKTGVRCLNTPKYGNYCAAHKSRHESSNVAALLAGGFLGAMAAPGLVPVALGAIAGKFVKDIFQEAPVTKKRVFVSFDFDNDQSLKHLMNRPGI